MNETEVNRLREGQYNSPRLNYCRNKEKIKSLDEKKYYNDRKKEFYEEWDIYIKEYSDEYDEMNYNRDTIHRAMEYGRVL